MFHYNEKLLKNARKEKYSRKSPDFFIFIVCFTNNKWFWLAPVPEVNMIGHREYKHMICWVKGQGCDLIVIL